MFSRLFSTRRLFAALILTLIAALVLAPVALAAPVAFQAGDDLTLLKLVEQLSVLAGFGALVALLVNIGKTIGWVKDGKAPIWVTGANLILLSVLYGLKVFAPNVDVLQLDQVAASVAQIGILILGLITQFAGAKVGHLIVAGAPIIGKSFSRRQ